MWGMYYGYFLKATLEIKEKELNNSKNIKKTKIPLEVN